MFTAEKRPLTTTQKNQLMQASTVQRAKIEPDKHGLFYEDIKKSLKAYVRTALPPVSTFAGGTRGDGGGGGELIDSRHLGGGDMDFLLPGRVSPKEVSTAMGLRIETAG